MPTKLRSGGLFGKINKSDKPLGRLKKKRT